MSGLYMSHESGSITERGRRLQTGMFCILNSLSEPTFGLNACADKFGLAAGSCRPFC